MFGDQQYDPATLAQQNRGAEPAIVPAVLDLLFTAFMRSPVFFDQAKEHVKASYFQPATEMPYLVLWEILLQLRQHSVEFTCSNITVEAHRALDQNEGCLVPEDQAILVEQNNRGLVWSAFEAREEDVDIDHARTLLREFLLHRAVSRPLRRFMEGVSMDYTPGGLAEFLDTIQTARQNIAALSTLPVVDAAPDLDTILDPPAVFNCTGLGWIDLPLGGVREGDAIGILGGTGSGKSTLAAHLAVASAKWAYQAAHQANTAPRWVGLFTYEESVQKMRPRVWSAAFHILRSKLETLTHPASQLTHRGNMEDYERSLDPAFNGLSEQDRWRAGRVWMQQTLRLFDMSGSADFPHAGRGYIPEVAACVEAQTQMLKRRPVILIFDYAGLICRNYIAARNMDDGRIRHLLAEFGNRMRREVAERFGCTCVILHQIAPSEGTKAASALLSHTNAAEGKAFAENLAACACISNVDKLTGCRRLHWSKLRYAAQEQVSPVTLRINEQFALMDDVSQAYCIDDVSGRFVHRSELNQIQGGGSNPATPRTARPPDIRGQSNVADIIGDHGSF